MTNVGAQPEIVEDGKTGFLVPPADSKALAKAIITLLKDDELRREMGRSAYKKATTDLSWDRIAEMTVEVYEKAVGKKKRS